MPSKTYSAMAQYVYYPLVKAGTWTIEQVPEKWRSEVQELIKANK